MRKQAAQSNVDHARVHRAKTHNTPILTFHTQSITLTLGMYWEKHLTAARGDSRALVRLLRAFVSFHAIHQLYRSISLPTEASRSTSRSKSIKRRLFRSDRTNFDRSDQRLTRAPNSWEATGSYVGGLSTRELIAGLKLLNRYRV